MKDNRFFDRDFDDFRFRDGERDFDFDFDFDFRDGGREWGRGRDRDECDCDEDFDFCDECDEHKRDHECDCERDRDRDKDCERERRCVRDHNCECREEECECKKDRDRDRECDCERDHERDRDCECGRERERCCERDREWGWQGRGFDCCEDEVFCSERFDFNEDERFGCRGRGDAANSECHWFENRGRMGGMRERKMTEAECKFCKRLKCRIMVLEMALQDTVLFLDTHPCDWEALCYYRQIRRLIVRLERLYERRCGPLTNKGVNTEFGWEWISCPYPWEGRD